MSDIQSISNGTYVIGETSATNFIAGQGIKIDSPSAGTVRIGNDETVLFESTSGVPYSGVTCQLSESWFNFNSVKLVTTFFNAEAGQRNVIEIIPRSGGVYQGVLLGAFNDQYAWTTASQPYLSKCTFHSNSSGTEMVLDKNWILGHTSTAWQERNSGRLFRVIGINRLSGSNA